MASGSPIFSPHIVEIFGNVLRSFGGTILALHLLMKLKKRPLFYGLLPLLLLYFSPAVAQPDASALEYFSPPLDIPLYLSGNFAELRRNHFHSGIDIKTQGVEGKNVLAAAEGYVSRIRISPYGYGKAVYIDHPNGYTTVYAHLQRLSPRLEEVAQAAQREEESFEIDLQIPAQAIPVARGERIAFSGNTGGSGGPHLHFEIRITDSELPLNPLLFKFPVEDNIKPTIRGLRVYPMNDSSYVINRQEDRSYVVSGSYGNYTLKNNEVVRVHGDIAFGVHTFDLLNGYPNKCGIYSIELFKDEELVFESRLDSLNFSTFRQINTYKDFKLFHERGWHYHRSYVSPHNQLQVYRVVKNNGVVRFTEGQTYQMRYEIRDSYGNLSVLKFEVKGVAAPEQIPAEVKAESDAVFRHDADNIFVDDNIVVIMPPNRLYEDLEFVYDQSADTLWACLTPVHHIHDEFVPVDKPFSLRIRVNNLPEELEDKIVITRVTGKNYHSARGGRYKDGWITTRVKEFGNYTVRVDTTPPTIRPINISNGKSMKGARSMDFKISDNLAGIKHFEGRIDGQWILMEFDAKNARLVHEIKPGKIPPGKRKFVLRVTDERNNVAEYTADLIF